METMKDSEIKWMGLIPTSWTTTKLKYTAMGNDTLFLDGDWIESDIIEDEGVRYLTSGNVGAGIYKDQGNSYISEKTFNALHCLKVFPGDIMISRLNEPVGRACFVPEGEDYYVVAVDDVILRPSKEYSKRYLVYVMNCSGYTEHANLIARGATMSRISRTQLGQFFVPVPGYQEQERIADYLDSHCSKLDKIIANLERQIELLQKYKKSLIKESVTKGLDRSKPMRDSGIFWIGAIPEHWKINRLRYLAKLYSGATPSKAVDDYWNGDIPWVSSLEVKTDVIYDTSLHINDAAIHSCSTKLMPPGTLVMVVRSGILQHDVPVALLGREATINQDIKAFECAKEVCPAFLKYFIEGHNDALINLLVKDKTTVESIDNDLLLSLKVALPPYEEQQEIVDVLDRKCEKFKKIFDLKTKQLSELKEIKNSLIYEYVTGKKRVKEAE